MNLGWAESKIMACVYLYLHTQGTEGTDLYSRTHT